MTPALIINQAELGGVCLALSESGELEAMGDQADVDRWIPVLREHKSEIVALLTQAANDGAAPPTALATTPAEPESMGTAEHRPLSDEALLSAFQTQAKHTDDRITCRQCQNLSYSGVCIVAYPGGPVSAIRGYQPISTIPHRCSCYQLKGLPHD